MELYLPNIHQQVPIEVNHIHMTSTLSTLTCPNPLLVTTRLPVKYMSPPKCFSHVLKNNSLSPFAFKHPYYYHDTAFFCAIPRRSPPCWELRKHCNLCSCLEGSSQVSLSLTVNCPTSNIATARLLPLIRVYWMLKYRPKDRLCMTTKYQGSRSP